MGCAVQSITFTDGGCSVVAVDGSREIYDKCIIAVHAPDALKILGNQVTYEESRVLGAFQYVHSDIFLHRDKKLMPCNQSAWSAWNFLGNTSSGVCLTYWLNALQNLDSGEPFLVTLNPSYKPMNTLLTWSTSHPVPSVAASKALLELEGIQGNRGVWFCGAYQGYGFHEDGLKAGILAAHGVLGNKYALLQNNKYMVPSLMETGARAVVTRFLGNFISTGYLTLLEDGGTIYTFGRNNDPISYKSVLKVHNPIFYWKIATQADLGLADAYINGDCSFVDNKEGLLQLFMIFIANRDKRISPVQQMGKRGWWTPLLLTAGVNSARYFLRHLARKNTLTQARQNVSQHYDLSNDFFSLFLDDTMSYSCALFKDDEEDLKIAQLRKISLLIEKARIDAKHEILEIGCGWGTLAVEVVKQTGCRYTGITLSEKQLKFAKKKVKEAGLQDHINFLLCDYRQLSRSQKYDRIISCEMIEAVGHEYFEEFFGCCESILAEDGVVVMQFISIPDERYDEYRKSSDFIKEYIFPGGCLPSLSRITTAMSASSRLCVEHLENIGPHYYKTLIKWRNNFSAKKSEIVALGFDEKFIRTWEYYFIYCAAGFRTRTLGNYQVVFSRPGNLKAFSGLSKVLPSVDLHSLDSEGGIGEMRLQSNSFSIS